MIIINTPLGYNIPQATIYQGKVQYAESPEMSQTRSLDSQSHSSIH